MSNKKLIGMTIAAAAAITFATAPVTAAYAKHSADNVKCYGANSCKGKSACKTAKNTCKGTNACKGQGMKMVSSDKACAKAGGKTTEE